MTRSSRLSLAMLVALGCLIGGDSLAFAQSSKLGFSPEQQKKYDELMSSAKKNQSMGVLAMQIAAGLCGLMLLYGAYSTVRHGLKINKEKRIEGTAARVIAAVLVLLAV